MNFKENSMIHVLCGLAVLLFMIASPHPVMAADKFATDAELNVPDAAKGFAGTIEGTVISRDDTGTTFVIKVDKATAIPKYSKWNKAKKPEKLKGQKVRVYARWFQVKGTKTYAPGEDHVRFVNGLGLNAKTSVDVYSDAQNRLILVEVPKEGTGQK